MVDSDEFSGLAARITELFENARESQAQIALAIGATPQAATKWKKGRIGKETLGRLAAHTGYSLEWLMTGEGPKKAIDPSLEAMVIPAYRYPIVSWVSAGMWEEAVDLYAAGVAEDWIFSTYKGGPRTFALRVQGDSMAAPVGLSFPEGHYIVADPDVPAENGAYIVARFPGSTEATFKQLVIDGPQRYLKPLNPRYPIIPITEECQICGVVKAAEMRF